MLDRLPVEVRIVFILRRVDRMSITEVAAQLGRSVATVKRRLAHVERMLDRRLADARTRRVRPSAQGPRASRRPPDPIVSKTRLGIC